MKRILELPVLLAIAAAAITSGDNSIAVAGKGNKGKGGGGKPSGPSYNIVKLDDANGQHSNGWANDINSWRQAVGQVDSAAPNTGVVAAHWDVSVVNGQTQSTLTLLKGGNVAYGINDYGEIVGSGKDADGNSIGLYWSSADADPIVLQPLPGADFSSALAINKDGVICGRSAVSGGGWQSYRAVAWRINLINGSPVVNGPIELPGPVDGSSAFALNDNDANGTAEVVGHFERSTAAVVWFVQAQNDGSLAVAPVPEVLDADSSATGINNSGAVCGQRGSLATLWDATSTTTLQRPTKGKNKVAWTTAFDISNTGVIVGRGGPGAVDARAVVWQNSSSSMAYLDSFLESGSHLGGLSSAEAVNDYGEIVGEGWNGAFIAIPK